MPAVRLHCHPQPSLDLHRKQHMHERESVATGGRLQGRYSFYCICQSMLHHNSSS